MDLQFLQAALTRALADPSVQADMAACPVGVTLEVEFEAVGAIQRLVLHPGQPGAGQVTCRARFAVWAQALAARPAVGFQSWGALRRRPDGVRIEGSDLHLAQALPMLERLLPAMREPAPEVAGFPRHLDALAHIQGSYQLLDEARGIWAYSEECGGQDKPALLMLHTAGSDARQWHGLMAQTELRSQWRMLAFDLPGHGRSPLPPGQANWTWKLGQDQYIDWVLRYLNAMHLERVVLMGCSMGAAIGLPLLARYPDRFIGAVLLETPLHSPGRRSPYLNHAQVHGGRLSAAWVGALLSPHSPASERDHATWIYSQSAPSVYDGDLVFYSDEFDARKHTQAIDTRRTPLWLLTGDYDYSATPADTQLVAQAIAGAHFQEMSGFGHFPMVENPDGLLSYLRSPLAALQARAQEIRGANG